MTQVETKNGRDGKKSKIFSSGELKNTKSLQIIFLLLGVFLSVSLFAEDFADFEDDEIKPDKEEKMANKAKTDVKADKSAVKNAKGAVNRASRKLGKAIKKESLSEFENQEKKLVKAKKDLQKAEEAEELAEDNAGEADYQRAQDAGEAADDGSQRDQQLAADSEKGLKKKIDADTQAAENAAGQVEREINSAEAKNSKQLKKGFVSVEEQIKNDKGKGRKAKAGKGKKTGSETSSFSWGKLGRAILLYLPNRIIDITDIVTSDIGIGPEFSCQFMLTRYAQFGGRHGYRYFITKGFHRQYGGGYSNTSEFGLACFYSDYGYVEDSFGTVEDYIIDVRGFSVASFDNDVYREDICDFWKIGFRGGWLIGLGVAVHPVEIADSITGFFMIDIMNDDLK